MATTKITADGETSLYTTRDNVVTLNINGTFGGGTLTIGYENDAGDFTAYTNDAVLTAPGEKVIDAGHGVKLMVKMTGSTTPAVNVENHGHYAG